MRNDRNDAEMLLRIAGEDYEAFLLLAQGSDRLRRQTLFHAQQAAEKALKAVLAIHGSAVRKTHDFEELYGTVESAGLLCPLALDELVQLTPYAAMFRYDDTDIPKLDVAVARLIVSRMLEWAAAEIEGRL